MVMLMLRLESPRFDRPRLVASLVCLAALLPVDAG
jgi:hypothetical protein